MTGLASGLAARAVVPAAVKAVPWRLIFDFSIALAFLAVLAWGIRVNDLRGNWQTHAIHSDQARIADRSAYEQAQRDATAKNREQVAKVEQQQQRITDETVNDLSARLELIRRELRKQAGGTTQGAPGSASAGQSSQTPTGTACPACLLITPEERLRGAEDEERHQQLIDWVLKQSQVNNNAPSTSKPQQDPLPQHRS